MKKIAVLILLMSGVLLFAACTKKMTRVGPSRDTAGQKDTVVTKTDEAAQTTKMPGDKQPASSDIRATDISPLAGKKDAFEFKDVLFDYDRHNIRQDARAALDPTAEWLKKNKNINVVIEGHCDERGTNEYNLALGEKRAKAVRDYLSSLGVSSGRMSFVTYGEERPLCAGQDEPCRQKNRRAHFIASE
ncbi:MAG: peptidoglycan-associated lipoprotein Pal [Nitrospiraceae bacterium]|nr:MAG: peptidoglycan-associated lipoprotein Pal [Nitrospiraceae bacterium]